LAERLPLASAVKLNVPRFVSTKTTAFVDAVTR
jgi:hypothetical protein